MLSPWELEHICFSLQEANAAKAAEVERRHREIEAQKAAIEAAKVNNKLFRYKPHPLHHDFFNWKNIYLHHFGFAKYNPNAQSSTNTH